jgi:hypothetical protein
MQRGPGKEAVPGERVKEVAGGDGGQERRGGAKKKGSQDGSSAAKKEEGEGAAWRGAHERSGTQVRRI